MTALITMTVVALLSQAPVPMPPRQQPQNAPASEPTDPLALQVMLDRAGFSPGVIDGHMGANTRKALALFDASGAQSAPVPATTTYRITADDAAGPFIDQLPADMMETAKLPELDYTSIVEELAERFHTTPAFLQQLNHGVPFAPDQEIQVPNVQPMIMPETIAVLPPRPPDAHASTSVPAPTGTSGNAAETNPSNVVVTVAKSTSSLTVTDASGRVVFSAPVTTGSVHDPLPIGEWNVTGIFYKPKFHYNPDLFWDADASQTKATLQPGPNSPVGVVWIDLSKEHYGLHGTSEPASIGRTQSHGCVRMTNWDALRVASLVKPGTPVVFKD